MLRPPAVVAAALPGLLAAAVLRRAPMQGLAKPELGPWGFDLAGMDKSKSGGDSFFMYANGKYLEDLVIPADKSRYGSFDVLNEKTLKQVRTILKEEAKKSTKLGMLYKSFMNEARVEELGSGSATKGVSLLRVIADKDGFAAAAGYSQFGHAASPVSLGIGEDQHDPTRRCVYLDQGGLGLPERSYYLKESFEKERAAYKKYLAFMLAKVNWPLPENASAAILDFETKIAEVSWPAEKMRDIEKTYNPLDYKDLPAKFPGFNWPGFFQAAGLGELKPESRIIVGAVSAVVGIAKLVETTDMEVLRSWMVAHYMGNVASLLSSEFVNASFAFSKVLTGQETNTPRWKRGVSFVSDTMGDELAQIYVKKHFPPESKVKVEELVRELKDAFGKRLRNLTWMTEATKEKALEKLKNQTVAIGYPPRWRQYTYLTVNDFDLFGNSKRSAEFSWNHQLGQLNEPVDKEMWEGLQPHMVNAFNMPQFNRIIFPAAILQPPFFDAHADMAVNFGGIGMVIGHEMVHSFDDEGRKYNASGVLKDWWAEADATEFQKRADSFLKQFAEFDLDPLGGAKGLKMNAELTMGEAIADLGGLTLAVDAYQAAQAKKPEAKLPEPNVGDPEDGYEGIRRVFLGFAQVWRQKTRPESLQTQVTTDPHPPAMARVDLTARNVDAWYKAFETLMPGSKPGSERAHIW